MLAVEKEMIGLLVKGASNPLENIQVSFFLVAWSGFLLAVLRMVRNGKKIEDFVQAAGFQSLAEDFAKRAQARPETGKVRPGVPPNGRTKS